MRKVTGVLLIAAAIGMAGCGDDGDSTGAEATATPTPTRAVFIQESDQICDNDSSALPVKLAAYEQRAKSTGRPEEEVFQEFVNDVLLPVVETRLEKIRALGMPEGGEQEVEEFLKAMENGVAAANEDTATSFAQFERPFKRAIKLGRAFGFKRCAR